MFQPALRAFDSAGAVAAAGPYSTAAFKRVPKVGAFSFEDLDLVVDLGDRVGTAAWWRGLATLGTLVTTVLLIGLEPTPLRMPVHPALTPAQLDMAAPQVIAPLARGATTGQQVAPTSKVIPLAEAPERPRIETVAKLRAVDSVEGALRRAGVGREDVATAIDLIDDQIDVRKLKPGTSFDLVLGRRENKSVPRPLESLSFRAAFDLRIDLARGAEGLVLTRVPIKVDETPLRISGTVGSSLYKSARASGVPARVVANYIKLLSHGIDFQRDVMGKDHFDIVVEHRRAETGETETGDLLYAAIDMTKGNRKIELMRWNPSGDRQQYFHADGISVKRGLMKTPVDGARMSSGFGMRLHPILGYSRLHKGVDFAAGTGTPIMAAASGTIVHAGTYRGYGNHVRIRHANGIETTYSHMSRYGKGATRGAKVEQGQVIGYVGSTGMSTGPHLHYEVYVGGKPVDPRSAKLPTGVQLKGGELSRFKAELARMRSLKIKGSEDSKPAESLAAADKKADKQG